MGDRCCAFVRGISFPATSATLTVHGRKKLIVDVFEFEATSCLPSKRPGILTRNILDLLSKNQRSEGLRKLGIALDSGITVYLSSGRRARRISTVTAESSDYGVNLRTVQNLFFKQLLRNFM